MGFFKKRASDAEDMARLTSEIESMATRLAAAEAEKRQLDEQLATLAGNVEAQREQLTAAVQRTDAAPATQADMDVVRGRLLALTQRVDATATAAAGTAGAPSADALDEIREQLLKLDRRIDEQIAVTSDSPGVDAAAITGLRERLDAVDVRLDAVASMRAIDPSALLALQQRLDDIASRFDVPISAPPTTPPPPPLTDAPLLGTDDEDDRVDGDAADTPIDQLDLATLHRQMTAFGDRIDGVDARLVTISRELALQIDELSGELDQRLANDADADDEEIVALLDELRGAQERLAAEQARYQIAFRSDLADLADQLTRA